MVQMDSIDSVRAMLAGTLRILIVDDSVFMAELMSSYLEVCPVFAPETVCSADVAREALKRGPWHACVLDLYLPEREMSLRLIRECADTTPIIAVSGKATGSDGYECGGLNVVAFCDKMKMREGGFVWAVFEAGLKRVLSGTYPSALYRERLSRIVDALFREDPDTVNEWADYVGASPRAIERTCSLYAMRMPNEMLAIYKLYSMVFRMAQCKGTDAAPTPAEFVRAEHYAACGNRLLSLVERTHAGVA